MKSRKKKRKVLSPKYFEQREIRDVSDKGFQEQARTGTRITAGIQDRIYRKGAVVQYKGDLAKVEKVTKQGIHIRTYKRGKDDFPSVKAKKTKFLSVEDVEKGKVYPYFTNLPDAVLFYGRIGSVGK